MTDLDRHVLAAHGLIGDEARQFKESDLYRCLVGMAEQEALAAQEDMLLVDPTDVQKIRELQNAAWRAQKFVAWLDELIAKGDEALIQWTQEKYGTAN